MAKQILMPATEFDGLLEKTRQEGRLAFGRELVEDLWKYAFPNESYNRNESMDTLWPKFLNRVIYGLVNVPAPTLSEKGQGK
jgi:hypothetical protein